MASSRALISLMAHASILIGSMEVASSHALISLMASATKGAEAFTLLTLPFCLFLNCISAREQSRFSSSQ